MDAVQTLLPFAQPLLDTWVGQQPHHGDQDISTAGVQGPSEGQEYGNDIDDE